MVNPSDEEKMIKKPLLSSSTKGGLRTLPFIIANGAFERVATFGLTPNMIMYLMGKYGMEMTTASNIIYFNATASGSLPLLGAFLADSFFGRYRMIGFGTVASLLGMTFLWLTTMIPEVRPRCYQSNGTCESPNAYQLAFLYSSFVLMSFGSGGLGASCLAFGADQLNKQCHLETYLSWYYASSSVSVIIALSCIPYIQENLGWQVGFGVPVVLMLLAAASFYLASSFYVKVNPNKSLLTGLFQVIVASYKNRYLKLSPEMRDLLYLHKKESMLIAPSQKLRFLNKACIIRDPQQDLTADGRASDPWSLCTVDQVEELKALIKVIPLWSTIMIVNVNISTFGTLQACSMDRHITSNFEIPAGSFAMFMITSLTLWLVLYDRIIVPLASKIMGKPARLNGKQKMGVGLAVSCIAMAVSAIVESVRRGIAIKEGVSDDPNAVVKMSAMWLLPACILRGVTEAFNAVGQNEFFLSEFPKSMSGIATTVGGLSMSLGNLLSSGIMTAIDNVTKRGGKESWVSSNINKGHYDYYYWVLSGLNLVNVLYFLACSWAYGPCEGDGVGGGLRIAEDETSDE